MEKLSILFDLDGTLWEVTEVTYESVNEVAKKHKVNNVKKTTICDAFGCTKLECAKMYFPDVDIVKSLTLMEEISEIKIGKLNKKGGNLYPNVKESIIELSKNYDLFIVSNTSKAEYIEAFLNTAGLKTYFKDYIAAGSCGITKSSAIYKIMDKHNIDKAIYVGDTIKDKQASDEAGIPFVQARYGYGENLHTKYYINDLSELKDIICNI